MTGKGGKAETPWSTLFVPCPQQTEAPLWLFLAAFLPGMLSGEGMFQSLLSSLWSCWGKFHWWKQLGGACYFSPVRLGERAFRKWAMPRRIGDCSWSPLCSLCPSAWCRSQRAVPQDPSGVHGKSLPCPWGGVPSYGGPVELSTSLCPRSS